MNEALYKLFRQCTIRLESINNRGTGFFVAPGKIITCAHVVPNITRQEIQFRWQGKTLTLLDMKLNSSDDLALLYVDFTNHPCAYLDVEAIPGDRFYSYGYPEASEKRDGASITIEYEGTADNEKFFSIKGENIQPGFSGSPLLNQRTLKVCGIIKSERKLPDRNIVRALGGYAIPLSVILQCYPDLVQENLRFHQKVQVPSVSQQRSIEASSLPIQGNWVFLMKAGLASLSKLSETASETSLTSFCGCINWIYSQSPHIGLRGLKIRHRDFLVLAIHNARKESLQFNEIELDILELVVHYSFYYLESRSSPKFGRISKKVYSERIRTILS